MNEKKSFLYRYIAVPDSYPHYFSSARFSGARTLFYFFQPALTSFLHFFSITANFFEGALRYFSKSIFGFFLVTGIGNTVYTSLRRTLLPKNLYSAFFTDA